MKLEFDAAEPTAPFIDTESGSRFGVEGRAVSGRLKGKTLTWLDSVQCKWFAWAAEHPETTVHGVAKAKPAGTGSGSDQQSALPAKKPLEMVFVTADLVTTDQIKLWRGEGYAAIVVLLDDDYSADTYRAAAAAASSANVDLYYWIEIARNKRMADAHPRWMASLGMHDDWLDRFPSMKKPKKGEVAKAYPWVPIGYAEAFQAHLRRVKELLSRVPGTYHGILLNDLQGGPASCGCGNLQCRWAIDYGVPATATKEAADDAAARFVSAVQKLAPNKQIVPIWMTECEQQDLPPEKAPTESPPDYAAMSTARRALARKLSPGSCALVDAHPQPLGLLTTQQSCGRDA